MNAQQHYQVAPSVEDGAETRSNAADFIARWQEHRFRRSPHGRRTQLALLLWRITYRTLFRTSPRPFHRWRRMLLRLFGAQVGNRVRIYPTARIWAPWNVTLHDFCCLGEEVDCYSVGPITIGQNTTISQRSVLCTATHDTTLLHFPLVVEPIEVGAFAWVAAEAFVMPGVKIGRGSVIGVRSTVMASVPAWKIAVGTPSRIVADRQLRENEDETPRPVYEPNNQAPTT